MLYRLSQNIVGNPSLEAMKILLSVQRYVREHPGGVWYVYFANDNYTARVIRDVLCSALDLPSNIELGDVTSLPIFPVFYPSLEFSRYDEKRNDIVNISERTLAVHQMQHRKKMPFPSATILIASIHTAIEKNLPFDLSCSHSRVLRLQESMSVQLFLMDLLNKGYRKVSSVTELGQCAVRGTIVDVFSPLHFSPVRLEFVHDAISSIRYFDLDSQRSHKKLEEVHVGSYYDFIGERDIDTYVQDVFLGVYRDLCELQDISSQKRRVQEELIRNINFPPGMPELAKYINKDSIIPLLDNIPSAFRVVDATPTYSREIRHACEILERDTSRAKEAGTVVVPIDTLYLSPREFESALGHSSECRGVEDPTRITEAPRVDSIFLQKYKTQREKRGEGVLAAFFGYMSEYLAKEYSFIICVSSKQRFELVSHECEQGAFPFSVVDSFSEAIRAVIKKGRSNIILCHQSFHSGFIIDDDRIACFTENEIFNYKPVIKRSLPYKRASFRTTISNLAQLQPGDIVVHELYGIGKFLGLTSLDRGNAAGEFLEVEYGGGAKLFVPVYDFTRVGKYQSSDSGAPPLTVLGSGKWEATKQKIKAEIATLTGTLLKTHAMRALTEGVVFSGFRDEEELFAESFPYVETADQQKAIDEVLLDMSKSTPMDRLVCGDVGFGKTEVAMRAAYRCVLSGYQVALVAPTTLLVEQHYKNFLERFSDFGVSVGVVSRFKVRREIQATLKELEAGKIDIIIGTHRLLQKDVRFKNLGLLVIDEEHKFGVSQKETLKRYRVEVDVLTLSATPIPRTLQQALHGTRELSIIDTPPYGRQSVSIRVDTLSETLLLEAIDREISRGGQVYVVQHLISGLQEVRDLVRRLCPSTPCEMAHGKMRGDEIESVMQKFYSGEVKVLISTAIIDSGIDVPNANTIIVLNPQDFGLAQLYQLKGRVGRGDKKAMSFFLYEDFSLLTDDSKRRLAVLEAQETSGSGFKLALQDMEIRGAGSLFGKDQTGHAHAIGFDMYFKILEEAVSQEKNRRRSSEIGVHEELIFEPDISLSIDMHISENIIEDLQERLIFYQRSLDINSYELYIEYLEEFRDRYGYVSNPIENFLSAMLIRNYCKQLYIGKLDFRDSSCRFSLVTHKKSIVTALHSDSEIQNVSPLSYRYSTDSISEIIKKLKQILQNSSH